MGFPTANVKVQGKLPRGVYAGYVEVAEKKHQAAIFCGPAETFLEEEPRLEAHILDFSGDLYNQAITVELVEKIRDVEAFETSADLVKQIRKDVKLVRQCLRE